MKRKINFDLPKDHKPHTDKYFLRSKEILEKEDINPYVRYQTFVRKGPGKIGGIDKSIAAIMKYAPQLKNNGKIYAIDNNTQYQPKETLMVIEGHVQDLIDIETVYLSIISEETGKANNLPDPDLDKITDTVSEIVDILENSEFGARPLSYFGARHFGYEWDADISKAAHDGGAVSASTDYGAETFGQKGVGTVPHSLVLSMASKYGIENSAVETMKAFDKHMDKDIPRIFLADTFNKEISDTLKVAETLGDKFWGPRFDTNGANIMEGGLDSFGNKKYNNWDHWVGKGVKINGVARARYTFNSAGYEDLKIALTSGFSNPHKVREFVEYEDKYNLKLFDFLGAGFADGRYTTTSDIMGYYNNGKFIELHKVGRPIRENPKLKEVDLSVY